MLAIILSLIFALIIAFLATMDASPANLYFGATELLDIPLFFVVFVSMIIGMILASVTTIKNLLTTKLTVMGKNSDLRKSYESSDQLMEEVDKLEGEKAVLKEQIKESVQPRKKLILQKKGGE